VEVVFALDTTGSMSGLIEAAKEKIWSIATTMASAQPAPEIRIGLVAYRDRGDAYVTKRVDLSSDLDSVYAQLMDFRAGGGGDGPESVNQALHDAVHRMSWSQDGQVYKAVFLVGDAPPHMDYQDDVPYPETVAVATRQGIAVNAVQCGHLRETTTEWRRIADLGAGHYFQVGQSGSAVAVATPFDAELAALSAKLDATRLYYGTREQKAKQQAKLAATAKLEAVASVESKARRATFNAAPAGAANLAGEGDLVEDVAAGRVDLSTVEAEKLPEPLRAMSPAQRKAEVDETAARRDEIREQIRELSEKRSAFVAKKVEEAGGAKDSLDDKIYGAVREQAAKAGLRYEAAAPSY
jgi:flavin-binding protein dodecin